MARANDVPAPPERSFDRKGFWALITTQFQGAFNDNLYQYVIMFLLVAAGTRVLNDPDASSWAKFFNSENFVLSFAVVIFSLPFVIFPALFGSLADRFSKQRVALATKYLEIFVMFLGGVAFVSGSSAFIWLVLFLMATQSAIFSPAKYGIIPEIVPEPRLSWANGILQMGTIIAIIAGTALAGPVYNLLEGRIYLASGILMVLSAIGIATAHFITRPPAANPNKVIPKNPLLPWSGMGPYFRAIWRDKLLFNVVLGYIYFWFGGVLVRQSVIKFGTTTLHLSETYVSPLVAAMAIGIGVGAVAAGYLSREKIETGIVPIGAAGMGVFALLMCVAGLAHGYFLPPLGESGQITSLAGMGGYYGVILFLLLGLGFFAGFFDVPLAAAIQARAPRDMKGGVIATTNMLTFVGMTFAGLLFLVLGTLRLEPSHVFLVSAAMSLGLCVYLVYRLPQLLLRAFLWALSNTLYRIRVLGRDYVPEEGGALLVANHISFVDVLALYASTDRDVTFLVGKDVFTAGWLGKCARLLNTIRVDTGGSPEAMARAVKEARGIIADGGVVCVSTERRFHPDAPPVPYHDDYGLIVEGTGAPVVPVHLARLWGSLYHFDQDGRFHLMRPPRLPYPIMVNYGKAAQDTTGAAVRETIQWMGTDSYLARPLNFRLMHHALIRTARRHKRTLSIADGITGELSYFKTLVGSIAFARKLQRVLDKQQCVGLLLPPSVGGALTNTALQFMGRVPVNLNYTASTDAIHSAARQCGITQVLTSRKFLERLPLDVPGEAIYLEDIRKQVSGKDRLVALLLALAAPVWLIDLACGSPRGRGPEDLCTIIFSSGSEGDPKGVMLTQRNLLKNIEAGLETFPHGPGDRMMAFLPFFHSFGFMGTLWLMLLSGCGVVFHANPLEPRVIGGLIEKYKCTFLIGTPTFLHGFLRRCQPEQLASLSFVVCGAEKLPERLRLGFLEKFGTEPMEGYGTTECAPVVSVNTPDFHSPGFCSVGVRHGSIGRPLPGVSLQVLDPDTGTEPPPGTAGLLHVRGPNIMKGYLDQPEKTAKVLRDGWYETGDIASVDEDGFITIRDRLARFSKIGGEMVPHTKVEETLHQLLGASDQCLAISSVPDERRGERLVVLHTLTDEQLEELLGKLSESSLPNLWRPRPAAFHRIDAIPVLGTGKMDIRGVREMARSFADEEEED